MHIYVDSIKQMQIIICISQANRYRKAERSGIETKTPICCAKRILKVNPTFVYIESEADHINIHKIEINHIVFDDPSDERGIID